MRFFDLSPNNGNNVDVDNDYDDVTTVPLCELKGANVVWVFTIYYLINTVEIGFLHFTNCKPTFYCSFNRFFHLLE